MSNEFEKVIVSIQKKVSIIFKKMEVILDILQGKLEDRKDEGLCGDVNDNTEARKRYEDREDDIDKNTEFRENAVADRNYFRLLTIGTFITLIGKIAYDLLY